MPPAAQVPAKVPVKCALPNCPVMFVPRAKTAKYCSDRCKRRGHAYRHVLRL